MNQERFVMFLVFESLLEVGNLLSGLVGILSVRSGLGLGSQLVNSFLGLSLLLVLSLRLDSLALGGSEFILLLLDGVLQVLDLGVIGHGFSRSGRGSLGLLTILGLDQSLVTPLMVLVLGQLDSLNVLNSHADEHGDGEVLSEIHYNNSIN